MASLLVLMVMAEIKREQAPLCHIANGNVPVLFSSLIMIHFPTSYWPKQVTAELRVRKGRNQDFTGKGQDIGTTL